MSGRVRQSPHRRHRAAGLQGQGRWPYRGRGPRLRRRAGRHRPARGREDPRRRALPGAARGPGAAAQVLPARGAKGGHVRGEAHVSFVGAGPGDPELITLKALRRLRTAEVVIYDRLVAPVLLEEAPADAERIDVGKARGRVCLGQEAINWLLVDRATRGGEDGRGARVVRLKGGDPGLFGRLAEEIAAVREAGVPFDVIPGVTAATAAAARTGISLTERGSASTVVFATGADHHGRSPASLDWDLLARIEGTLVFYM